MAKDNSFDIVSETDMQEVENAFNNTEKGLKQRYDLKDSGSKVDFDKGAKTITVLAPSDFVSSQVIDVLNTNPVSYTHLDVYKRQNIILGAPSVVNNDPRRFAYSLLDIIIGGGMSSRLFQEIREKRGLVYSVYASSQPYEGAGIFEMYAGCLL